MIPLTPIEVFMLSVLGTGLFYSSLAESLNSYCAYVLKLIVYKYSMISVFVYGFKMANITF